MNEKSAKFEPESRTEIHWGDQPDGSKWRAEYVELTEDGWSLRSVWTEQRGEPVQREAHVRPRSPRNVPEGGVSARLLQRLHQRAKFAVLKETAAHHLGSTPAAARDLHSLLDGDPSRHGGRVPLRTDIDFARLAAEYLVEVGQRRSGAVTRLAQRHHLTPSRMSGLLHEARQRGLLTPGTRGRAGGAITDRARALLQSASEDALLASLGRDAHGGE